jgi:signal peptidase I
MADGNETGLPQPTPPPSSPAGQRSSVRDFLETVVFFIVVAALLLKTFVAEAYVIPTGSMATTLWGNQKDVQCPRCGYTFPVNCSSEGDAHTGPYAAVVGCTCPNCRYEINFQEEARSNPGWTVPPTRSGDRVLVAKYFYDLHWRQPERHDVVVFKFPREPQKNQAPVNYIKRLIGKPGETIGIYHGNLYVATGLTDSDHTEQLKHDAIRKVADPARKFHIIRKAPEQVLALRRIVYDNDFQPGGGLPPRWTTARASAGWSSDDAKQPRTFQHSGSADAVSWLRYQHIVPTSSDPEAIVPGPELITDFLGYNSSKTFSRSGQLTGNWVGDLILECTVRVEKPEGELRLELSRGEDRFQARFQLATGTCTLWRLSDGEKLLGESGPTRLTQAGEHVLRFANVDERLTVWVDNDLPFGDGIAYDPPRELGPTRNDLQPASVGARGGAVTVSHLRLWRDTYYTVRGAVADGSLPSYASLREPRDWTSLRDLPARTLFVEPGHYLCLGDNSPESSDGREWGLVPQRLLLGRALLVLYPFTRAGPIR